MSDLRYPSHLQPWSHSRNQTGCYKAYPQVASREGVRGYPLATYALRLTETCRIYDGADCQQFSCHFTHNRSPKGLKRRLHHESDYCRT